MMKNHRKSITKKRRKHKKRCKFEGKIDKNSSKRKTKTNPRSGRKVNAKPEEKIDAQKKESETWMMKQRLPSVDDEKKLIRLAVPREGQKVIEEMLPHLVSAERRRREEGKVKFKENIEEAVARRCGSIGDPLKMAKQWPCHGSPKKRRKKGSRPAKQGSPDRMQ